MPDSDCIFCKLVKGEIPCNKVYEDKDFFAFLDMKPISKGHILVIPKRHYKDIFEIPEDELSEIMIVVKKIVKALDESGIGKGYSIIQHNREEATQAVFHIHFHIIPRALGDKSISAVWAEKPSEQEMQEIANRIKNSL